MDTRSTLVLALFIYITYNCVFVTSGVQLNLRKEGFDILKYTGFNLTERLQVIYYAESAKRAYKTNFTAIVRNIRTNLQSSMKLCDSSCFAGKEPLKGEFSNAGKFIYLRSDADSTHILCFRSLCGNSLVSYV